MPSAPPTVPLEYRVKGVKAKIDRAYEGIDKLNAAVEGFFRASPPPCHIVGGLGRDCSDYVFRGYCIHPPPMSISILTGEILYHLRSALDHLVSALAQANGETALRCHQFPIHNKWKEFRKSVQRGHVKGVSGSALRKIIRAQPYRKTARTNDALLAVHAMNVADKHSLLTVVSAAAKLGNRIIIIKDDPTVTISFGDPSPSKVTREGAEIYRLTLSRPYPELLADCDFAAQIAFEKCGDIECAPVIPAIKRMADRVKTLVDSFAPDLGL